MFGNYWTVKISNGTFNTRKSSTQRTVIGFCEIGLLYNFSNVKSAERTDSIGYRSQWHTRIQRS